MAELLGVHTILDRALPTGVDGARLAQWQMRQGMTYSQFAGSLAQALAGFNQSLMDKWGFMFSITEEMHMEYPDGQDITPMQPITDVDKPDEVRGTTIGHMIDMTPYGERVGGSRRFFRDARMAKLQSTIRLAVDRARWRFEIDVFKRFFTNTEYAIGSAGWNVPFVRGTGGNVDYTPPAYSGKKFTKTHNHFIGFDSGSKGFDDMLNGLADTVQEHGHEASFVGMVSMADVASYSALGNFVKFVAPVVTTIDRGGATSGSQLFANGQPMVTGGVFGYYQSDFGLIELRAFNRIPTGYAGLFKSYGQDDPRNPLAVRVHPDDGFGAYIVPETTDDRQYPLKRLTVEMEHGVGVGEDRTNGAVGYRVSGGAFANPNIT